MEYRIAEVMLFHTCNFNCGYCGFATSGLVRNIEDLAPFRDKGYIDKVFNFFEKNSSADQKWILHLSGGEPMLMPNADYFSRKFISAGHKIGYNTNLSMPVERNSWMDDNPPDGIDALIVSLHLEALDRFHEIFNRVRILREAGYPIAIRMVAHPQFFERFDDLHEQFKDIDVSFGVNALYSPNYPKSYSDNEKAQILKYTKVNYEFIRLNGGLDVSDRKCHAGNRILCVSLGVSGGGDVYPCVNTAGFEHRMGNIFEDDVTLFSEPGPCLRQDKCCSCALHFINNIIPGVDDSKAHYRMLKGYVPSIEKTYKKWVEERKIETVFHQGTPQGTEVGETLLVIEPPKLPINSGLETPPFESGQIHPLPDFSEWIVEQHSVATSMASEGKFYISTLETKYETLTHSPVFYLETGRHVIRYRTQLKTGGIIVGIQDTNERWLTSNNHMASKTGYLSFENDSLLPKGFYITVSSWNAHGGITQLTLSNLSCRTYSKLLAPLRAISFLAERILRFPQALFRKL